MESALMWLEDASELEKLVNLEKSGRPRGYSLGRDDSKGPRGCIESISLRRTASRSGSGYRVMCFQFGDLE